MKFKSILHCMGTLLTMYSASIMANNSQQPIVFELGRYLIDTTNKTVSNQIYWEKDEQNGKHAWGFDYQPDPKIIYDKTRLIIRDDFFGFQEYYDEYKNQPTKKMKRYSDIEGYQYVNGFYLKDGKYFYLHNNTFNDAIIPQHVDFDKLKSILKYKPRFPDDIAEYYYDENHLYYRKSNEIIQLASAKNSIPVMREFYCEYGGKAYQKNIDIGNINQLFELDFSRFNGIPLLTNGTDLYNSKNGEKRTYQAVYEGKLPPINEWQQITTPDKKIYMKGGDVYLSLFNKNVPGSTTIYSSVLFSTAKGYIIVDEGMRNDAINVSNVFFFDYTTGQYEPLEVEKYTLYLRDFMVYKTKLYYNSLPIANNFDMANMRYLKRDYGAPNGWLSDGENLFNFNSLRKNSNQKNLYQFATIKVSDIKKLQPTAEDLLVDGVNFYQITHDGINVIPIKALGFEVDIKLSHYVY